MGDFRSWVFLAFPRVLQACVSSKIKQELLGGKLGRNRERDAAKIAALGALGYRVLLVWECEVRDRSRLEAALREFFYAGSQQPPS